MHNSGFISKSAIFFSLVLLLVILPVALEATVGIADDREMGRHWYMRASHLLDKASIEGLEQEHQVKAKQLVEDITQLSGPLWEQERELHRRREEMFQLKSKWTWFLDAEVRHKVDIARAKVNEQQRIVENLFEEMALRWKQLKPHFGVFSQMFLAELVVFFMSPIFSIIDFLLTAFSLGFILALVTLGPLAFFVSAVTFSIGMALIPIIGAILVILWTLEFPGIVLQYDPSPIQFFILYLPFLAASAALAWKVTKSIPRRRIVVSYGREKED